MVKNINLLVLIQVIFLLISLIKVEAVTWQTGDWAFACDFKGNDLSNAKVSGDQCGGKCVSTSGCTHFTWTTYNGGTCWMKQGPISKSNAFDTGDKTMVCGVVSGSSDSNQISGSNYPLYKNVLTTYHGANEVGSCRLPKESYSYLNPVALGNIDSLQSIKFKGTLCGHILEVDCGKGLQNIIITNSNLGGGLDLYASSWNKLTKNKSPGQEYCSVRFTALNPFRSTNNYKCYHATGETSNQNYRSITLLNTGGKILKGASLKGQKGTNYNVDSYFNLNVFANGNDIVTFYFEDNSSYNVLLKDCIDGSNKQYWS